MWWQKPRYAPAQADRADMILDRLHSERYTVKEFVYADGMTDAWKYRVLRRENIADVSSDTFTVYDDAVHELREATPVYGGTGIITDFILDMQDGAALALGGAAVWAGAHIIEGDHDAVIENYVEQYLNNQVQAAGEKQINIRSR